MLPYPKRTPPKATKRPTRMAGKAEPAAPSGFLIMRGMMCVVSSVSKDKRCTRRDDGKGKMKLGKIPSSRNERCHKECQMLGPPQALIPREQR